MARAVLLLVFAALASLGAALDDDAMAACLRCVNWSCEGNEPHSEICSDCLGEDCDECRDAIGNSELAAFVSGGCNFYDGSEVGNGSNTTLAVRKAAAQRAAKTTGRTRRRRRRS